MNKKLVSLLFISIIFTSLVGSPVNVLAGQNEQANLEQLIDDYFIRLSKDGFSGAVLVANEDEVILQDGYGIANDSDNTPVTADTIFDVGSISKQFTASAILYLEQQRLLNVKDPISKYFDNVPSDKANITIHQLLTHSAGFTKDHFDDDLTPMTKEEAIQAIFALPLGYQPGTEYSYSNTGYTLLAIIVENVSGQSFTSFMHQFFFEPLGMNHTGFYNDSWINQHVANTYWNGADQGNPSEWQGPYWGVMGNGGVMSTVGDLYLWWQSLQNHTILSQEQADKLFTRHISEGSDSYYGYGWSIQDSAYGNLITHNGGGIGGNSDFAVYTEKNLVIIICSNRITWKTLLSTIPYEIRLPASDTREQLANNIFNDTFTKLPNPTFLLAPYLVVLALVVIAIGAGVTIIRRQRKNKRNH